MTSIGIVQYYFTISMDPGGGASGVKAPLLEARSAHFGKIDVPFSAIAFGCVLDTRVVPCLRKVAILDSLTPSKEIMDPPLNRQSRHSAFVRNQIFFSARKSQFRDHIVLFDTALYFPSKYFLIKIFLKRKYFLTLHKFGLLL